MGFLVTTLIFVVVGIIASLCARICCNRGPSTNLLHLTLVITATLIVSSMLFFIFSFVSCQKNVIVSSPYPMFPYKPPETKFYMLTYLQQRTQLFLVGNNINRYHELGLGIKTGIKKPKRPENFGSVQFRFRENNCSVSTFR